MISNITQAQENPLETESISVFKNNSAFFIKSGTVNTENGQFSMSKNIPAAMYGTLWFHSPDNALKNISSFEREESNTETRNAKSVASMIKANMDKRMRLILDDDVNYEGTIESLEMAKQQAGINRLAFQTGDLLTIKTESEWVSFPISRVKKVVFLGYLAFYNVQPGGQV